MPPLRRIPIVVRLWARRRTQTSSRPVGLGLSIAMHALIAILLVFISQESNRPLTALPVLIAELVQEDIPAVQPAAGEDANRPSQSLRPEIPVKGQRATAATATARPTFGALLALVERAHRPQPVRTQPAHVAGNAVADIGGGENDIARGSVGNTPLKDFIRAQIERRWQVDARRLGARHIVVSLRLVLNADGGIEKVDIVEDAARASDPLYRIVASGARNAALLSSPLHLPAGISGEEMDITLDLDTKDALR